jgi:hypothetical protein
MIFGRRRGNGLEVLIKKTKGFGDTIRSTAKQRFSYTFT